MAFEQSYFFFAKKNGKNIKFFGDWIEKKTAIVKTGASFLVKKSIPHFSGGSLRLEQHNIR